MGQKWVELAISKEATKEAEEEEKEENEDQQFVLLLPAQLVTTVASNQRGMTRVAGSFERMSHTFTRSLLSGKKRPHLDTGPITRPSFTTAPYGEPRSPPSKRDKGWSLGKTRTHRIRTRSQGLFLGRAGHFGSRCLPGCEGGGRHL